MKAPMLFSDFLKTTPLTTLFSGTKIDSDTQQLIATYFQFRRICDDDTFQVIFNRTVKLFQDQYLAKLRIQLVEFDPMVADYMERLHENSIESSGSNESTTNGSTSSSDESNSQGLMGTTPDSTLYPTSGFPDGLAWKYASQQQEAKTTGSGNTSNTQTVGGEHSEKIDTVDKERYSGRHESPQDLMLRALKFIEESNALEWFLEKLQPCFFGIYDW